MIWSICWLCRVSIWLWILAQVMISGLWDQAPGWALCWACSLCPLLSRKKKKENHMIYKLLCSFPYNVFLLQKICWLLYWTFSHRLMYWQYCQIRVPFFVTANRFLKIITVIQDNVTCSWSQQLKTIFKSNIYIRMKLW